MLLLLLLVVGKAASDVTYPTLGAVWPQPLHENTDNKGLPVHVNNFHYSIIGRHCKKVDLAIDRFQTVLKIMLNITNKFITPHEKLARAHVKNDSELLVNLKKPCSDDEYPYYGMDESYNVTVSTTGYLVVSDSVWGIIRGLETLSHLVFVSKDFKQVMIKATNISDSPHYLHRGLMLDTSRHYIAPENIFVTLDGMAMNKMNVFHWHVVDDESFPYVSQRFPELSKKGAYFDPLVYTKEVVQSIKAYARDLGIRVVMEFPMPGNSKSWGQSHPEILTDCNLLGPMNPIKNETYDLLREFLKDVQSVFPDNHIHLGGNEIDKDCWTNNKDIMEYMKKHNMTTVDELLALFYSNVFKMLKNDTVPIVSEDVFLAKVPLSSRTLVHVRNGDGVDAIAKVLNAGHLGITSGGNHMDDPGTKNMDWKCYYDSEPRVAVVKKHKVHKELLQNLVGGEASLWGQKVDDNNMHIRLWPRACAVGEVLWSETTGDAPAGSDRRMEEQQCRLLRRGVPATPANNGGFCILETTGT